MSFVRVPPDGSGKKVHTAQHSIGADTVETQVIHLADNNSPTQTLAIDARGAASIRFAEGQPILSGFGNLKVAQERAIGVYESSLDTYSALFNTVVTGAGQMIYNPVESSEVLEVDGLISTSVKSTTNRYHYYLPGTSNIYKMTVATGDTGKAGNTRRWGAFDDNDGIFFELSGTTLNVVIRNSTSGSVVETKVPKSAWNVDKLDGTGLSGLTLTLTNVNVYWIDYQWLGAGRVRFGIFGPDGSRVTCHQFQNAGGFPLPYMRTGTLPARLENTNTTATGSASQLRIVCIGVYAEGTYEDYTFWRYSDIDAEVTDVLTSTTAVAAIRCKATINSEHNSVIVYPETLNVYCSNPVAITLWQAAVVSSGTWTDLSSAGQVSYNPALNLTAAQKFKTIYFNTGANSVNLDEFFEKNDEGVQVNADGVPEIWAITATKLTASATTLKLNIGYKELW